MACRVHSSAKGSHGATKGGVHDFPISEWIHVPAGYAANDGRRIRTDEWVIR